LRAVIDTNVLLSALLWRGAAHALIDQVRTGALSLVSSPFILAELAGVISRAKFRPVLARSNINSQQMLADIRLLAEIIEPSPLPNPVCRDPDDDEVLALAQAALPDLIVTGDTDLLVLGDFAGIPIVAPTEALAIVTRAVTSG
jgi:putative PIN family toxin of toxin-antitoxin system